MRVTKMTKWGEKRKFLNAKFNQNTSWDFTQGPPLRWCCTIVLPSYTACVWFVFFMIFCFVSHVSEFLLFCQELYGFLQVLYPFLQTSLQLQPWGWMSPRTRHSITDCKISGSRSAMPIAWGWQSTKLTPLSNIEMLLEKKLRIPKPGFFRYMFKPAADVYNQQLVWNSVRIRVWLSFVTPMTRKIVLASSQREYLCHI